MSRAAIPIEPYIEKLVQAVMIGASYELAAKFAGISYKTFERWRQQAEHARAGTPLATLRDRLREAEGLAAIGWLAKIEKAASEGDWRAAAFKLERRYPDDWGRKDRLDLRMHIEHLARRVADEMGVTVEEILVEAQALLTEGAQS
jgi:hypothetical protein